MASGRRREHAQYVTSLIIYLRPRQILYKAPQATDVFFDDGDVTTDKKMEIELL